MSPVHLAARTDRSSPGPQADLPQPSRASLPGKIWGEWSSNSQSGNAWWVAPLFLPEA